MYLPDQPGTSLHYLPSPDQSWSSSVHGLPLPDTEIAHEELFSGQIGQSWTDDHTRVYSCEAEQHGTIELRIQHEGAPRPEIFHLLIVARNDLLELEI